MRSGEPRGPQVGPDRRVRLRGNTHNLTRASAKCGQSLAGSHNVTLTVTGVVVVPEPGALDAIHPGWFNRRMTETQFFDWQTSGGADAR